MRLLHVAEDITLLVWPLPHTTHLLPTPAPALAIGMGLLQQHRWCPRSGGHSWSHTRSLLDRAMSRKTDKGHGFCLPWCVCLRVCVSWQIEFPSNTCLRFATSVTIGTSTSWSNYNLQPFPDGPVPVWSALPQPRGTLPVESILYVPYSTHLSIPSPMSKSETRPWKSLQNCNILVLSQSASGIWQREETLRDLKI